MVYLSPREIEMLEEIESLKQDLSLSRLSHKQKVDQLLSCETALNERDQEIESLKAQLGQYKEAMQVAVKDVCEIHGSIMISRGSWLGLTEVYYNPEYIEGIKLKENNHE